MIPIKFLPGDVGFIMHHDNKLSKIIAWFMNNSIASHTFKVAEQTDEETYLVETSDFQVVYGSMTDYITNPNVSMIVFRHKNLTDQERIEVVRKARKCRKTMYGYLQLLSLGVRRLLMRVGITIPNFIKQGMVCTHVVTYGYKGSSVVELSTLEDESIDTEELYQIIKNSSDFEIICEKKRGTTNIS